MENKMLKSEDLRERCKGCRYVDPIAFKKGEPCCTFAFRLDIDPVTMRCNTRRGKK
uniref:Uncharacterized protein n=1 Tax=viral metagenome TaxID=1070528 RepID=A0A6M3JR74_9ZZZZ